MCRGKLLHHIKNKTTLLGHPLAAKHLCHGRFCQLVFHPCLLITTTGNSWVIDINNYSKKDSERIHGAVFIVPHPFETVIFLDVAESSFPGFDVRR